MLPLTNFRTRPFAAFLAVFCSLGVLVLPPLSAQEYSTLPMARYAPFEAITAAPASAVRRRDAVNVPAASRARAEQIFRRLGALGPHTPLVRSRLLLPDGVEPSTPAAPAPSPLAQIFRKGETLPIERRGAPLTFTFTGFETAQTADFQSFLQTAYPLMVELYGEPAPVQQGKTVKVQFDQAAGDGFYQLPSGAAGDGGTILYDPVFAQSGMTAKQVRDINNYNLTRQILIAFHGPRIFSFDAWELGFSDAAALIVNYKAQGSRADFDPSALGAYLLPAYDFFNRPELGNPVFFSSNTSPNLGFFRAAIAQAAWLKVYVENPHFFKSFNERYYAQASAAAGVPLAGNTPALKSIAASLVPAVEGLPFNDWYRRQYVLDTAITTGEKLWAGVQPLANLESGDTRSVFFGVAQHYRTDANGNETPLAGVGRVRAFNENGAEVTNNSAELSADNRLVFNSLGEAEVNSQNSPINELPVVGFSNIGVPGAEAEQARLSILFQVNNAQTIAYFPYNVAGTVNAPSGFYGASLGAVAGTVQVQVVGGSAATATLTRAAFKSALSYPSGPRVQTIFTVAPGGSGATRTVRRNSAWSFSGARSQSLGVLLETTPGNAPFTLALSTSGDNRLRMFSLPFTPAQSDEASVLGVTPASLLLARYRPNLSPKTFSRDGITYGVTADKHELYPNISQPFAPGRGYWLKLAAPVSRSISGGEPDRAQSFEVPLLGGWNQIGTPFNLPFEIGAIRVRLADGAPVNFATAVANRWVSPGIWRWKPEGGYARVDTGAASQQLLQPFEGYYIFSPQERGVRLIFNANARTAALNSSREQSATQWQIPLAAHTESSADEDNAFGVTPIEVAGPAQPPAAKAPAALRTLTLSFHSGGTPQADSTRAGHESGWAQSLVAPFEDEQMWSFQVDGATPGELVRLRWGDVNALPQKLACTLVESVSGKRISMNSAREWAYTASGVPQQFRIEARVVEHASQIAYFTSYSFRASRLLILTAAFRSAGAAHVKILTPAGEVVRTLASRQEVEAERYLWQWDGLDDSGQRVSGQFVARLEFDRPGLACETRELAVELK